MIGEETKIHSTTQVPLTVADDLKINAGIETVGQLVKAGPKGVITGTNEIGRRSLETLAEFVLHKMGSEIYKESGWDKWRDAG